MPATKSSLVNPKEDVTVHPIGSIRAERFTGTTSKYLLEWVGAPADEAQWLPASSVPQEFIDHWYAQHPMRHQGPTAVDDHLDTFSSDEE